MHLKTKSFQKSINSIISRKVAHNINKVFLFIIFFFEISCFFSFSANTHFLSGTRTSFQKSEEDQNLKKKNIFLEKKFEGINLESEKEKGEGVRIWLSLESSFFAFFSFSEKKFSVSNCLQRCALNDGKN